MLRRLAASPTGASSPPPPHQLQHSEQGPTAIAQRLLTSPWMAEFLSPASSPPTFASHDNVSDYAQEGNQGVPQCAQPRRPGGMQSEAGSQQSEPATPGHWQVAASSQQQPLQQLLHGYQGEVPAGLLSTAVTGLHQDAPIHAAASFNTQPTPFQPERDAAVQLINNHAAAGPASSAALGKRESRAQRNWTKHAEIACTTPVEEVSPASPQESTSLGCSGPAGAQAAACTRDMVFPAAQQHAAGPFPSCGSQVHEDRASGQAASLVAQPDSSGQDGNHEQGRSPGFSRDRSASSERASHDSLLASASSGPGQTRFERQHGAEGPDEAEMAHTMARTSHSAETAALPARAAAPDFRAGGGAEHDPGKDTSGASDICVLENHRAALQ